MVADDAYLEKMQNEDVDLFDDEETETSDNTEKDE